MKTAILLTPLQRSRKCAVYVRLGGEFLLAPPSQFAKLADATTECRSECFQLISERVYFTLRFAHPRSLMASLTHFHTLTRATLYNACRN